MRKQRRNMIVSAGLLLLSAQQIAGNELADAFDEGIMSSLKVIKYEKQARAKNVQEGRFCLSMRGKGNKEPNSFVAIKLESLGLMLGTNPSYYRTGDNHRIMCLFRAESYKEAEERLSGIREKGMGAVDRYFPHIVKINSGDTTRIIPALGELYQDESKTVISLSEKIARLKKEKFAAENERARIREAFSLLISQSKDLLGGKAGMYGERTPPDSDKKGVTSIIVPKEKNGRAIDMLVIPHNGEYVRFVDKDKNVTVVGRSGSKVLTIRKGDK